jgi:Tol biopolymer transport system component
MNSKKTGALVLALAAAALVSGLARATGPGKNGLIAYRNPAPGRIWVVAPDGSGLRKLTTEKGGQVDDGDPDWSPDGSRLAFDRCHDHCQVWTIGVDGDASKLLGPAGDDRAQPAWSPDGKTIAYSRFWGGVRHDQIEFAEIYVMTASGTGPRQLTHVTTGAPYSADVEYPAWSPDGKQIVFAVHNSKSGDPAGGRALFVMAADGSGVTQLTPWDLNGGGKADWSPDGSLILFRSISRVHQEHSNLYTIHPDGTAVRKVTNYPEPKTVNTGSFSPDGKWIVFSRFTNRPYPSIYTMHADGTGLRQLIPAGKIGFVPDWGPGH